MFSGLSRKGLGWVLRSQQEIARMGSQVSGGKGWDGFSGLRRKGLGWDPLGATGTAQYSRGCRVYRVDTVDRSTVGSLESAIF